MPAPSALPTNDTTPPTLPATSGSTPPTGTPDDAVVVAPLPPAAELPLYRGVDNAGVLQGPVIGRGTIPNDSLTRSIPFDVGDGGEGLRLTDLTMLPSNSAAHPDRGVLLGTVHNTSDQMRCEVEIDDVALLDAAGDVIEVDRPVLFGLDGNPITLPAVTLPARGVVGRIPLAEIQPSATASSLWYTGTCVPAGSAVHIAGIVDEADRIARVTGTAMISDGLDWERYGTTIAPLTYELDDNGNPVTRIVNRGTERTGSGFLTLLLFDAADRPLAMLEGVGAGLLHEPGEERESFLTRAEFAGQVSTVRVIVDYDGPLFR